MATSIARSASASTRGIRTTSRRTCVSVRASGSHKPVEPVKFQDIPASQRVFTDAQWESAIAGASGKTPAPVAAASTVSIGDAFAFAGPLPETVNGRLAMLGFVAAVGAELSSGQPVLAQLASAPGAVIGTMVAFVVASLTPILKGANLSEAFGPLTPSAEKLNGRAAMIGLVALLAIEASQGKSLF
ncbi:hypothetical protein V8C86DRAFT_1830371 [Haematococcus lacustris]